MDIHSVHLSSVAGAKHVFKDRDYYISMSVENEDLLKIQVEDEESGEQWVGKYGANYIEELTHKTGNFKEFEIFYGMLESGLEKTSDCIELELKTLTDLEVLRNHKSGMNLKSKSTTDTAQSTRRYLIMTYTVEFDKIRYPLSLHYVGKFDPAALRKILKQQKEEIESLKEKLMIAARGPTARRQSQSMHRDANQERKHQQEIDLLKAKLNAALRNPITEPQPQPHNMHQNPNQQREIDSLKAKLNNVSRELSRERQENRQNKQGMQNPPPQNLQHKKKHGHEDEGEDHSLIEQLMREKELLHYELEMSKNRVNKEIKILQRVVEGLESDLLKERSKHKHILFKKNTECKRLAEELEGVKSSERNLRVRVKSLTEELALLKGFPLSSPHMKLPVFAQRWAKKSSSPAGRFDPTAYIAEKQRKQHEKTAGKRVSGSSRAPRSRSNSFGRLTPVTSTHDRKRPPSSKKRSSRETSLPRHHRTSSAESFRSRHSSIDSGSGRGRSKARRKTPNPPKRTPTAGSMPKNGIKKSALKTVKSVKSVKSVNSSDGSDLEGPQRSRGKVASKKSLSSVNRQSTFNCEVQQSDHDDTDDEDDKSLNIDEIDARLNALQQFMKESLHEM